MHGPNKPLVFDGELPKAQNLGAYGRPIVLN
jgi:hypothetical protein